MRLFTIGMLSACLSVQSLAYAESLAVHTDPHGLSYVTGGIGAEEVEALQAYKKQFNIYVVFSEGKSGRVIDDVDLTILNASKQVVFSLKHAEPRVLLSLPSGAYLAIARYQGSKQRVQFQHDGSKHQRIIINWKNPVPEDSPEDSMETPEETPSGEVE